MTLTPLKPDFALSLSFDGIRLVTRAEDGWLSLGDVALDAPDLRAALAELRFRGEAMARGPVITKLVIPNDQIRYLTFDIDPAHVSAETIAARLEGATPYPVADLAFDWCISRGQTQVAAVAAQTLKEADAFARDHAFDPVSYVAIPPQGSFDGEVFFGPVDVQRPVARDGFAIRVTGVVGASPTAPLPDPEPAMPAFMRTPDAAPSPVADPPPVAAAPKPVEVEEPAPVLTFSAARARREATEPPAPPEPQAPPAVVEPPIAAEPKAATVPPAPVETPPPHPRVEAKASPPPVDLAKDTPPPPPQIPADTVKKQRLTAQELLARRMVKSDLAPLPDPAPEVTKPEVEPEQPAKKGFSSIRAVRTMPPPPAPKASPKVSVGAPRIDTGVAAPAIPMQAGASPRAEFDAGKTAAAPPSAKGTGFFSRQFQRGARAPVPALAEANLASAAAADQALPPPSQEVDEANDELSRMTVFGARATQKVGGKPKYLGLVLTALLLVFLVGVAAMAAVFVDERIVRFFAPQTEPPTAAELAEDDIPLVAPDAPAPEAPVTVASLGGTTSSDAGPQQPGLIEALSRPDPLPQLSYEDATASYAITGIWQLAPDVPNEPTQVPLGNLYVPLLDPMVDQYDALAIPALAGYRMDVAPRAMFDPAPAGTVFDLDDRGFVRATPDGAMSPDGVTVFAGKPPFVPPVRDVEDAKQTDADASAAEDAARLERLAAARPKARPEGLTEDAERARLGGKTLAELAKLRPKLRPASAQQAALAKREAEEAAKAKAEAEAKEKAEAEAMAKAEAEDAAKQEVDEAVAAVDADNAKPDVVTGTKLAVAASRAPKSRPRNFSRIVARAQPKTPKVEEEPVTRTVAQVKPKTVKPPAPSRSSVTRNATVKNAIKLNRINLIGVYGKPSSRRALVRMANGRYKKVKVGDRLDGGRISAIGDGVLKYTKNGRSMTLKLPKT